MLVHSPAAFASADAVRAAAQAACSRQPQQAQQVTVADSAIAIPAAVAAATAVVAPAVDRAATTPLSAAQSTSQPQEPAAPQSKGLKRQASTPRYHLACHMYSV